MLLDVGLAAQPIDHLLNPVLSAFAPQAVLNRSTRLVERAVEGRAAARQLHDVEAGIRLHETWMHLADGIDAERRLRDGIGHRLPVVDLARPREETEVAEPVASGGILVVLLGHLSKEARVRFALYDLLQ